MTDHTFDIVVVGAGPAGLAAAKRAAESGASVALLDDNPQPGGQIWRSDPAQWQPLLGKLEPITGARVIAVPEPGRLTLEKFDGDLEIGYGRLILATGARERFLPFPGWTLPNVMGAGGLQALAKSGLPIEGKKVVVAGSGPLLLAVARFMRGHGAKPRLVAEQASDAALLRFGLGLVGHPGKLLQTLQFGAALLGVRHLTSCWPIAADGSGKLESVTLYRAGRIWKEPCDYLACGFGLIPNVELPALLGCRLSETGVEVDDYQQTSVPGVYAAGEVTGIGGLDLSLVEGEIAGNAAAGKPELAASLFGARTRHRRFAASLEKAFALREELKNLTQDDTLVCRCEDVSYERVRRCSGWRDAKLHTRCGMGPCQGRVCGGAVEFLLGWKPESVRPPVFPARIQSLSGPRCPRP
ncbi:MAG: NAD(P)/FAD-dependent oxidoreductase [Acidobacteriia bacterium]|nr:NAD(P)/FAD-dependent oxidoreductase [Terriglobia bacterium]